MKDHTDEAWLMWASQWRKRLGLSGNRSQVKRLARALAEKSYDYVGDKCPRMSVDCCEALCIAMSAWLMFGVEDGSTEDTLIQMMGFAMLKGARG